MNFLESIMDVLNGSHGAAIFRGLHQAFLLCLALAVLLLFFAPRPGRRQFWFLAIGLWLALLGVAVYQAVWQLAGFQSPEFVRFMRFHDPRPDVSIKQVRRGVITDWRGTILAQSDPQDPWRRIYPLSQAACHAVGYMHPRYGMSGVERAADATLCGYQFASLEDLDRFGKNLIDHRASNGGDVQLTLDAELQSKAYDLMGDHKGAVIVMRPSDGAILCLVSKPGFNPNNPAEAMADTQNTPLLNRATQGLYPPGSTFKMLMAGLASERHVSPQFNCPGEGIVVARSAHPIRDSEYYICLREGRVWAGHGRIGLRDGFVHSSNVYFAQLGLFIGHNAFNDLLRASLLDSRIAYFSDPPGVMFSDPGQWRPIKSREKIELAQMSIGQGHLVVTPLHVAMWTAAIAARGMIWQPHLRAGVDPMELGRVLTPDAAAAVKTLMRDVVAHGTGRPADIPGLNVCGKTGTAEVSDGEDHAWFTCFAPLSKPEVVVTVLVEHGGYGSRVAAPIARAILEEALDLGLLGMDHPNETEPAK